MGLLRKGPTSGQRHLRSSQSSTNTTLTGDPSLLSLSDSAIPDSIPGNGKLIGRVSLRRPLLVVLLAVAVVVGRGLSPEVLLVVGRCCC